MIDSENGHRVLCEDKDICPESSESSIYLMQNLRVGDSNCLTFFDSGANTHLIDRQLARQEELQLTTSKAIALGVTGGGSIKTEYGSFRFNLGQGEDGKYHEITAVGMEKVTSGFGEYNLEEVIREYKEFASGCELEYVLAESVGGTKVHLLLGIKNTRIQPTLLKVLPSGVGVYLSPFKDIWDSRIIFAGPNKVFTKTKKEQLRDSNHEMYTFEASEGLVDDWEDFQTREIRFDSIGRIKNSLYSSPIEDEIFYLRTVRIISAPFIRL